jgi:casein kinase II subunit alpha
MAEIIFQKGAPFFKGDDNNDQLIKIAQILGTDSLISSMKKFNVPISSYFQKNLGQHPKIEFEQFITK